MAIRELLSCGLTEMFRHTKEKCILLKTKAWSSYRLWGSTEGKPGIGWSMLERYHFVVSTLTLALGLKINFNKMDGISKAGGDKMAAN